LLQKVLDPTTDGSEWPELRHRRIQSG